MKKIALILLLSITMSWLSSCDEKDAPSVVFTALIPDEDMSSQRPGSIIKDITMSQGINSFNLSAWGCYPALCATGRQDLSG